MTRTFEVCANGNLMGEYKGEGPDQARDAFASDAGYEDYADLLAGVPGSSRDEIAVFEIDTARLVSAASDAAGEPVFQDSYGNGIAVVKGVSYATYRDLSEAFGLDITDFEV